MKRKIAAFLAFVLVLSTCMTAMAASYSVNWKQAADGNWQAFNNGVLLKNTWILDDQCDVAGGLYYLVDENGNLVSSQLIKDGEGRYYTFNDQHDGHFGAMRTANGKYQGVNLTFSAVHDGSFGSITNADGIKALAAKVGVKEMPSIKNASMVKMSDLNKVASSTSGGSQEYTIYHKVDFDVNFATATPSEVEAQMIKKGGKVVKPASPSDATTAMDFKGWTRTKDGADYWNFEEDLVTANVQLFAKWENAVPASLSKEKLVNAGLKTFTGEIIFGSYVDYSDEIAGNPVIVDEDGIGFIKLYNGKDATRRYVLARGDNEVIFPEDCTKFFQGYKAAKLIFADVDTSNVTVMQFMFDHCSALTELDVSSFDTGKVTDMNNMFAWLTSLKELNVTGLNTANVTDFTRMFYNCSKLTELDVSGFDTAKATNFDSMFSELNKLEKLDVSGFNTANVTNMHWMFFGCKALTELNLSSFNTGKVTNMLSLFYKCEKLTKVDLSSFNTENVTDMSSLFEYCKALTTVDLSSFNTKNVTTMAFLFEGCKELTTIDLSSFDTKNVTGMRAMFKDCEKLTTITVSSDFVTTKVQSGIYCKEMFTNCTSLVGGSGTAYDSNKTNKEYARIDQGPSAPGYFTGNAPN